MTAGPKVSPQRQQAPLAATAAVWSFGQVSVMVASDGTTLLTIPVLFNGTHVADLTANMTPGWALTMKWTAQPAQRSLSNFQAWQG